MVIDEQSYVAAKVKKMPIAAMDPSMSLGFYFQSMADLADFERRFADEGFGDLFTIADSRPKQDEPHVLADI